MNTLEEKTDNRIAPDRRKWPTPLISRYSFFGGQRRTVRRESDKERHIFVDQYSTRLFIMILLLLFLNMADAYFSLTLIRDNIAFEANPIMAFFLGYDNLSFFVVKFFITAASLFVFCLCKNIYITRVFLVVAVIIYISIVFYELHIISRHYPLF